MHPILIIGGGISGVTAAVELAEAGREVVLVERSPYLGGNVVKMHNYFPKLCPPACGMEINFRRIRDNRRIRVLTMTEVQSISGTGGALEVKVVTAPQRVNDCCTACGDCTAACPVERPDDFNYGMGTTKAVYLTQPFAFPQKYTIDAEYCTGTACSKCVEACQYSAIDLKAVARTETLLVHSVITATGWRHYDPSGIGGLNYSLSPDIVTNVEFERLLSVTGPGEGKLLRPSDGKQPASVAFVQCAGSRDKNHLPYCSAVCCSASLKHALNVIELLPETNVTIFYIDLRVSGRNEDFLGRVEQAERISLVKGKVAAIEVPEGVGNFDKAGSRRVKSAEESEVNTGNNAGLVVVAEDIASGRKVKKIFDMVVLATGIVPMNGVPAMLTNTYGFYPAEQPDGIFPAACAKRPMDVSASVKDATAAALQAMK
jgi:quinone-modifying oxidoreductase, subunit QmoA